MFNSLEKAREILEKVDDCTNNCNYEIPLYELFCICRDYLIAQEQYNNANKHIESLKNYIRLLEKENQELRGENV